MNLSSISNLPVFYTWVAVLLLLVIVQCSIWMKKAWKRAKELGMDDKQLKKAAVTGILISILPTLPVLIVFLSLGQLLGMPLPWLRLSIIGSAGYESYAASTALQCLGEELTLGGVTVKGWVAAAWVMTVGGSISVLWSILAIRPIASAYKKAESMDVGLVMAIGTGCLIGIMAYVSVSNGWGAMSTKGIVFTVSFVCGAILKLVQMKCPGAKWLSDYLMAISMLVAMIAACIIF